MPIGALLGAGASIISGITGGIAKRKAEEKRRNIINQQLKDNENWYQRRYNEDSTQRADAQNSMRMMRDALNTRARRTAGTAAVTGETDASLALEKQAANQALGSTVANIAAAGEARKDSIEQQYQQNKQSLNAELGNAYGVQAQNTANAISGVTATLPNLADSLSIDDWIKKLRRNSK